MSKTDDGGQAFPIASTYTNENGITFPHVEPGMTLRDYFAAQVLNSIVVSDGAQYFFCSDAHARTAYAHADAMLAERAKGGAS